MKNKLRIKTRLKMWQNDKLVLDTTRHRKSQILLQLERAIHNRSYICVSYDRYFANESEHSDDSQLRRALSAYTEKPLLDFVNATESSSGR